MKMFMMINLTMNLLFMMMKHPLTMGMIIIIQTTFISIISGLMYKSFWFSFILFLMFIGGMMVLFIYMTSLVPNKMFSMSNKNITITMLMIMMMYMLLNSNYLMMNNDMNLLNNTTSMLMKMYNSPMNISIMLMALYLLFTMITVFKITDMNSGPLRMMMN
uniref:NADH-ubiquinone oxidoreductase chain 6 n=1 Tax=Eurycantha calcarata TaxID=93610 RepID=A0A8E5K0A2_9NEOP|nr:NADH dehydrogenase subunit 6 [Eurycantha calcarata]QVD43194.1 NADH dehydrogenase subunit 6 [Eurycantha calcarata]